MAGVFISFEGPDGAGKTTQLHLLAEYLRRSRGLTVLCTREPGGTDLGNKIRSLLLNPTNSQMSPRTEALLYMAARAQHVSEIIAPALSRGEVVLSDRYFDSTIVYQGVARKLKREDLTAINQFATSGVMPHLTLLLDCTVTVLEKRMTRRGAQDRMERESTSFHQKVRQGFLELAKAEPKRIKKIDAARDIGSVHESIVKIVEEFFTQEGRQ